MSETQFRVCVVDDEPMILEIIQAVLEDRCVVECFSSADACLQRVATEVPAPLPDMFLLDVRMSGMDGYALCQALKECPETADIPVTFISGYDTIEARLAGYDAGGEDFIVKPFQPPELLRKVEIARRIGTEKKQLHEMAGYAQRTAFSAMTSMGELGIVLDFLRKSFACGNGQELAGAVLGALEQYGLHGAVQVRLGGESHSFSAEGSDLPLETAILNHVRNQGRIFEFKTRSVYNYGGITILVKNMPLDDAETCGRIRDNLAILAEGADARRQAIEAEMTTQRSRQGIDAALGSLRTALETLRQGHQESQLASAQLMIQTQEGLLKSFVSLGLTERQENQMVDFIHQQFEHLRDCSGNGDGISRHLEKLADELGRLTV